MPVEGVVLVQGKRMSGLGRLDVQRGVVQFHVRPQQLRQGLHQPRVGDGTRPGLGIEVQVVHGRQPGLGLGLRIHVGQAPGTVPSGTRKRPVLDEPVHLIRQSGRLFRREYLRDVEKTVLMVERDLLVAQHRLFHDHGHNRFSLFSVRILLVPLSCAGIFDGSFPSNLAGWAPAGNSIPRESSTAGFSRSGMDDPPSPDHDPYTSARSS